MPTSNVRVEVLPTAGAWLDATSRLRGTEPVLMNLPGSIAEGVKAGIHYDSLTWIVVIADEEVVGCATRTAPWPVVVGPMAEDHAAALGAWMAANLDEVTSLTGPTGTVAAVANGMGRSLRVRMREVVRVLDCLALPRGCPGSPRPARVDDLPLLMRWFLEFHAEAALRGSVDEARVRHAVSQDRLWIWADDEGPAAMGGHAPIVTTPGGAVARIGPIYTDPSRRALGFGSALTHAIARRLLERSDMVMLFADAENATSNRVYERLGFKVAAEVVEADLG